MTEPAADPTLEINASRLFTAWLRNAGGSLAFSTYQAGKLFLIGLKPDGSLSVFERSFPRAMGLAVAEKSLWLASLHQLWRFVDFLEPGQDHQGHDALYVPMTGQTTGDIDIHDVMIDAEGRPVFVATLFNCLGALDPNYSFRPLWRPPFIDRIAAEDRCHLNGLAMRDGRPAFVTAVSESNIAEGWRDQRAAGGVVIDVASGEIVARGLSMPHSPRWRDGKLWLLNAGTAEFGYVEPESGRFEPVAFLPGFLRGLTFLGEHAVIGLSQPRGNKTMADLPWLERLEKDGVAPKCGLRVVDLATGDVRHALDLTGVVSELYDVTALPGVIRPMALGFKTDEIRTTLRVAPER